MYRAAVLDRGSRKIVGWAMDATMKTTLTLEALQMALTPRMIASQAGAQDLSLIPHSDRGVQDARDDYPQRLGQYGVQPSMSARGGCDDNAAMESFWATLKGALVHQEEIRHI